MSHQVVRTLRLDGVRVETLAPADDGLLDVWNVASEAAVLDVARSVLRLYQGDADLLVLATVSLPETALIAAALHTQPGDHRAAIFRVLQVAPPVLDALDDRQAAALNALALADLAAQGSA